VGYIAPRKTIPYLVPFSDTADYKITGGAKSKEGKDDYIRCTLQEIKRMQNQRHNLRSQTRFAYMKRQLSNAFVCLSEKDDKRAREIPDVKFASYDCDDLNSFFRS
jgi:hypothetical protein